MLGLSSRTHAIQHFLQQLSASIRTQKHGSIAPQYRAYTLGFFVAVEMGCLLNNFAYSQFISRVRLSDESQVLQIS